VLGGGVLRLAERDSVVLLWDENRWDMAVEQGKQFCRTRESLWNSNLRTWDILVQHPPNSKSQLKNALQLWDKNHEMASEFFRKLVNDSFGKGGGAFLRRSRLSWFLRRRCVWGCQLATKMHGISDKQAAALAGKCDTPAGHDMKWRYSKDGGYKRKYSASMEQFLFLIFLFGMDVQLFMTTDPDLDVAWDCTLSDPCLGLAGPSEALREEPPLLAQLIVVHAVPASNRRHALGKEGLIVILLGD
jgi:hypothetical protein